MTDAFWNNLPATLERVIGIIAAVSAIVAAIRSGAAKKEAHAAKTVALATHDATQAVKAAVEVVDKKTDDQTLVLTQAAEHAVQAETNTNGTMDRLVNLVERVTAPGVPGGKRATDPPQKG